MLELYFKYRRVMARFRNGALGNEMDRIAAHLSETGYKRDSAKLYLARIVCFSAYATRCGCDKSTPIPQVIVDRYLQTRSTTSTRQAAQVAIGHATQCCPERFAPKPLQEQRDPVSLLLAAYLQHLRLIRGLAPKTCEGLVLTARRMLAWQ